ncbi:MAG TPA: DMT family transporter [Dongiaceae bacterium]|jgi:drug/metabolite transporter (DMT)-like permease|nr:DMT family transporter [Dongiaceae bacterium]
MKGVWDYGLLCLLSVVWGSAFVFIKVAGESIDPLMLATLRVAIGGAALALLALVRGRAWPRKLATWGRLFFLGIVGNALPFMLVAWGERYVESALAAIIMGLIPLGVLVIAHFTTHDEKWRPSQALAVALGFAGIVTMVGWDALGGLGSNVFGQCVILGAACSYSFYGVTSKKLEPVAPEVGVAGMLLMASLVMIPLTLVFSGGAAVEWRWVGPMLWLGIVCTGGGNLLFLMLLRRTGANFVSLNNYLVPLVGLIGGAVALGERPGPNALLALTLILAGLALPRLRLFQRPA